MSLSIMGQKKKTGNKTMHVSLWSKRFGVKNTSTLSEGHIMLPPPCLSMERVLLGFNASAALLSKHNVSPCGQIAQF